MRLQVVRKLFTTESTIGELLLDGAHECLTLEDVVRDTKLPGITAIPAGTYPVTLRPSPSFHRIMPALDGVPGYTGVLIHWGNTAADTRGCLLVGESQSKNFIGSSVAAFNRLFPKLQAAADRGEAISIHVA